MTTSRFLISDLVEIQRKSFFRLLEKGIIEEFSKRNPITNLKKDLEIFFFPEYYKLTFPEFNPRQAVIKSKSYSSKFYVPVQLIDKKAKKIQFKWVLLGHLPLMTKRGHFLINGAARVIVNQIIRSPGIYFQEKIHEIYLNKWSEKPDEMCRRYYADLICLRGTWLRLEIDKNRLLWAQMKKGPKIPVLWLLIGMGLSERTILKSISYPNYLLQNFKKKKSSKIKEYVYVQHPPQAWEQLFLMVSTKKPREQKLLAELGRKWLFNKFMNPRTYDLGKQGRISFNKKLNLALSINQTTLTPKDVLFATEYLIKVEKGLKQVDDIDHLKNRRVRTSGELIQIQFGIGLLRLEKTIRDKINKFPKTPPINHLMNTKALNGALREFFGSSPLSQFMDQINPLAEITHKRRLSSLGPGGVTRDTATLAIRGIHPTHYGRICPIETPEGKNTGLVNSMTTFAKVNPQGLLETPFYKVIGGQVQKNMGMFFLSAEEEEKITVAAADINTSVLGFLPKYTIPVRMGDEFTRISRDAIDFIAISPIQMISIATSLIPFLEHDDANRALMGSNMQRQAVPLIRPEQPIVGTGLEARAASDSGHVVQSKNSGIVIYSSAKKIVVCRFLSLPFLSNLFDKSNKKNQIMTKFDQSKMMRKKYSLLIKKGTLLSIKRKPYYLLKGFLSNLFDKSNKKSALII
uniref:DNA-directed RNA polymerase n=1 Tax=Golenkinia longispicula TaxID=204992 RepID=A0A0S2IDN5_9CHLO|nr:beta subunit of RNA polymerase [Golenkinia longispicula]